MQLNAEGKAYDDINVTPMLDLAYVLLLIFIIMTTAAVQGIDVNLPKASDAPSLGENNTRAISIDNRGQIFLDTVAVSLPELESRLRQLKATKPDQSVVVKGDAAVQYASIVSVLDLLRRLDFAKVGLATQQPTKAK